MRLSVCCKRFTTWQSTGNRRKYCSRECRLIASRGNIGINEHWEVADGITCIELVHRDGSRRFVLLDTADYHKVASYHWNAIRGNGKNTRRYYAAAVVGAHTENRKFILMHRLILDAPKAFEVDHIDGNGLNNSSLFGPLNIRLVTSRQNHQNLHVAKSSRYPGVSWNRWKGKWSSYIKIKGKVFSLGAFLDETAAAQSYRDAVAALEKGVPLRRVSRGNVVLIEY